MNLKRKQTGVGLFEILISIVLLSIGFLASAQMQLQGMRFGQGAHFRSEAHFLASDMIDRMRRNRPGVQANLYKDKSIDNSYTAVDCASVFCSPAQLAAMDLYEWSANIYNLRSQSNFVSVLPKSSAGADATATISSRPDGVYTILVSWKEYVDGVEQDSTLSVSFKPL